MTEQELKEVFELLERSGMNPQLCDTPVPYYENEVPAGIPTDPGDIVKGDYIMLPRELLKWGAVFIVKVRGDSMRDAGIMAGDKLQVQVDAVVDDGDIVVASIDGELTVKAFYADEQGQRWLVPCNSAYEPILLREDMNVRLIGKVVGCMKESLRTPFKACAAAVKRAQATGQPRAAAVSRERVEEAVRAAAPQVKYGRQWYAVYRAMVDRKSVADGDYAGFVELLREVVPEHTHLPRVIELQRMAVQSFSKPVVLWEKGNAPVAGQRYDDYLRIARIVSEKLKT